MKKLAVLTSGGDAPGMNAAIRSVVRCGVSAGYRVVGIRHGYAGLITGEFEELSARSVSNIIQRGGTVLRTTRCEEFKTCRGLEAASKALKASEIEGLIAIGGDGTVRGAIELQEIWNGRSIVIPATIDNDLGVTEECIGFDTAVNTAVAAVDKIRDTADSHERFFLVEVMGRLSGALAWTTAVAVGAEEVVIPETRPNLKAMCDRLCAGRERGKTSSIIIVAEGNEAGNAYEIAEKLKSYYGNPYRVVVLGHLLRGGAPSARDRDLATRLGAHAIDLLAAGERAAMAGIREARLVTIPLAQAIGVKSGVDPRLPSIIETLSI